MGQSSGAGKPGYKDGVKPGWSYDNPGPSGQLGRFVDGGRKTRFRRTLVDPSAGERFGELTATGSIERRKNGQYVAEVRCSCGASPHWVAVHNLRNGKSTRCNPCAKKATAAYRKMYYSYAGVLPDDEHRRRLLNRLSSAVGRCHNPKNKQFSNYGGRGISVCEEWRTDKASFLKHVQTLPGWDNPVLEMDRRDTNGNYEPGNIRFITKSANAFNKRKIGDLQALVDYYERCLRSCKCGAAPSVHCENE